MSGMPHIIAVKTLSIIQEKDSLIVVNAYPFQNDLKIHSRFVL